MVFPDATIGAICITALSAESTVRHIAATALVIAAY
jgi:hypothetical protein